MWIADTQLHLADGTVRPVADPETFQAGAACLCLSEAEFEAGSRKGELNELALEVCEELAARQDHVWNECVEAYESERWFDYVLWGRGEFEPPEVYDPGCVGG